MNFKIGDIVICVNNSNMAKRTIPPININSQYVVANIYVCPRCKTAYLDVGIPNPFPDDSWKCVNCAERPPMKEVWWCNANRFVKNKSKEEVLEEEDYEGLARLNNDNFGN